ncbi:MAG: tetratricopeptide repeat protein [Elusimicrobiota bacterium]
MIKELFSPLRKGIKLMMQQKYDDAALYFIEIIKKKPNFSEAYFELGRCCYKKGDYEAAKSNFHRLIDLKCTDSIIEGILEMTNWRMISSTQYFNNWPSFSSDGKWLAYVSVRRDTNGDGKMNASDCGGIYMFNTETGQEQYLVSDEYFNSQPVFSPDGTKILYLSARKPMQGERAISQNSSHGLYLLDLNTSEETELLEPGFRSKHAKFSADGKHVIFSGWRPTEQNSGIYSLDIKTKKLDVLVTGFYENTSPFMTRGADKIVYSSWRSDTNGDGVIDLRDNSGIFIKDLLDKTEMLVSSDEYNNSFPSFSPDGKKILYLSVRRDTNRDGIIDSTDNAGIYVFDLANNKEYCVMDDSSFNKFPSFTPDGQSIVFISNWRRSLLKREIRDFYENKGVYVIDMYIKRTRRIVSEKYYGNRSPVVSPAGGTVAYISWRKDTNRGLFLANMNRLPTKKEMHNLIDWNL